MLKTQDPIEINPNVVDGPQSHLPDPGLPHATNLATLGRPLSTELSSSNVNTFMDMEDLQLVQEPDFLRSSLVPLPDQDSMFNFEETYSWDMIALGLEEPLPDQGIIDDMCVNRI